MLSQDLAITGNAVRASRSNGCMEDPEYRRLGDTQERIIALVRDRNAEAAITIWESLTVREQRMLAVAMASMIAHLRAERGDPPGAVYGPE